MTIRRQTQGVLFLWQLVAIAGVLFCAHSLSTYRPPIRPPASSGAALPRLTPAVVLVIIDGLSEQRSGELASLNALRRRGASAQSRSVIPSVSQPSWTTLLSGAIPEVSGTPTTNVPYAQIRPLPVENLFELARARGLRTALFGNGWWDKMVPRKWVDYAEYTELFDDAADRAAAQSALRCVRQQHPDLTLVYFGEYDELSHKSGTHSRETRSALQHIDRDLAELVAGLDLRRTTLMVTSDHGQLERGGHGGTEPIVMETPFVLAGRRVRSGVFPAIREPDVPTTAAALLGLPIPGSSRGEILYRFLDATPEEEARGTALWVRQRTEFTRAYLAMRQNRGPIADTTPAPVPPGGNADGAAIANLAVRRADALFERERNRRANTTRAWRLAGLLPLLGWLFLVFRRNVREGYAREGLLALIPFGMVHAAYVALGFTFSWSLVSSPGAPSGMALTAIASMSVGLGLACFYARKRGSRPGETAYLDGTRLSVLFSALITYLGVEGIAAWIATTGADGWESASPTGSYLFVFCVLHVLLAGVLYLGALTICGYRARRARHGARAAENV